LLDRRRVLVYGTATLLLGCELVGLVAYSREVRYREFPLPDKVDVIVCLAGGSGRIEEALNLFSTGMARFLLISGTGQDASLGRILEPYRSRYRVPWEAVRHENVSVDTLTNAREAKNFLERHGATSMLLITAEYHLPRALHLFTRVLGDGAHIHPHPTLSDFSPGQPDHTSLLWLRLLVTEYLKDQFVWLLLLLV